MNDVPLVDRRRLGVLTGGDAELHRELTELFALQVERDLGHLEQIVADHAAVARAAHRLRGAATNLGAARLGAVAEALEELASRDGDCRDLVASAREVFALTCAELRRT